MPKTPKTKKTLEEIVEQTSKYPFDAFVFVQECIGVAAQKAHGSMTEDETVVARWMAQNDITPDDLCERWETGSLPKGVTESLHRIGGPDKMNRHISGQQLCWAVRDTAVERWGMLGRTVLERWNITATEDIGEIVFALVDNGHLQKQPTDNIEDFRNVFSFYEAFDKHYRIPLVSAE